MSVCFPQLDWRFVRKKNYSYYSLLFPSVWYIVDIQQIVIESQQVQMILNLFHIVTNCTLSLLFLEQNTVLLILWTLKNYEEPKPRPRLLTEDFAEPQSISLKQVTRNVDIFN